MAKKRRSVSKKRRSVSKKRKSMSKRSKRACSNRFGQFDQHKNYTLKEIDDLLNTTIKRYDPIKGKIPEDAAILFKYRQRFKDASEYNPFDKTKRYTPDQRHEIFIRNMIEIRSRPDQKERLIKKIRKYSFMIPKEHHQGLQTDLN